ncbi:uncharacterized protein LOC112667441 isoform X2 [Canis lupus dingo]|uniref:Uncharacterized protein n=2 Tax=Canis lupus TaxID=9612 RepID=A0A8P0SZV6_CANLF|nr:uncharacterized protein LOC112667441 isoform X2 [Canis lupus dingo]XP_048954861.1 uncharacterized protein LOC112667441 isoform X2 [Canis lupus dingo]|eukprot:XP_022263418.1 uncharacterized protein CHCHD8 isoform X2 [Canis lupus familiaris]
MSTQGHTWARQVKKENEEEDPLDQLISRSGCAASHYAVQECMAQHQDWRHCQPQDLCLGRERGPQDAFFSSPVPHCNRRDRNLGQSLCKLADERFCELSHAGSKEPAAAFTTIWVATQGQRTTSEKSL